MFTNAKCYAAILLDADFMMLKAEKRVEFHPGGGRQDVLP